MTTVNCALRAAFSRWCHSRSA